jgi:O-antigen/teichoic acid export membrane protein
MSSAPTSDRNVWFDPSDSSRRPGFDQFSSALYPGIDRSHRGPDLNFSQLDRLLAPVLAAIGLRGDRITRAWLIVTSGSVLRLALGFVASVVIARALGPVSYGVYAVLGVISGIAGVLFDPGLTSAAVRFIASVWSTDPFLGAKRAGVLFSSRVALATVGLAAWAVVAARFGVPEWAARLDPSLVTWTLVGVVVTAASGALAATLQAIGSFRRLAIVLIANSLLTAVLAIGLAEVGRLDLVAAVVILGVVTSVFSTIVSYCLLPASIRPRFPGWKYARSEFRAMFAFGRWLWIGDILALVSGRIDLPIVAQWLDPVTFGAYAVALNLASKVEVINHSLFTVMLPEAAAAAGPDVTRRFLAGGFRRTAVVTALLLLTVPIALPLINWLYGSGFAAVGPIFVGLLLVAIVDLLATPLLLLPFQLNRPRLLAAADIVRAATVIGLSVLLVPPFGVVGAIAARLTSRLAGIATVAIGLGLRSEAPVHRV